MTEKTKENTPKTGERRARRELAIFLLLTITSASGTPALAQANLDVLALEPVVTGLGAPVALTHAGRERLFVTLIGGQVMILENGELRSAPFLDISDRIDGAGLGLWSVAFHPDVDRSGWVFAHYAEAGTGDSVISRFRISEDSNRVDPETERVLLRIPKQERLHYGGSLQFGPDGYLYVSTGDGTGRETGGDPECVAQSLDSLEGKILRLDVDRNADSPPYYAVPADNPFAPPARDEIWAFGLRNPWRLSFDRETGDLWISDVGQDQREEIDYQAAGSRGGQNYGWKVVEGTRCFGDRNGCGPSVPACGDPSLTPPVIEYGHADGHCSIIGGYVYRGRLVPGLYGAYVYGDFCSGAVWAAFADAGELVPQRLPFSLPGLTTFGEDAGGELWLMAGDGLHRLVNTALPAQGLLELDTADLELGEDAGTVEVAVHRLGGTAGTVSVEVTARAETATDQADFRAPAAVLTWAAGDAESKTFPLEILDDVDDEPDENLTLELLPPSGGAVLGARSRTRVTILDDDGCVVDDTTLCLNRGRFRVRVEWRDFEGNAGFARRVLFGSDQTGLLWFFDPDNWEMMVKVIDGCSFNERFWVFSAATTNVEYTLEVADTLAGVSKTYRNELGVSAPALTDIDAFASCGTVADTQ